MDTTAPRPTRTARRMRRRLVVGSATLAATTAIGLGVTAVPAEAARHNPCATARAVFRAHMNEARFWLNAADTLAAGGNSAGADAAQAEAEFFMSQAQGALDEMGDAC